MMGRGETVLWRCGGKVVLVWLLQRTVLLLLDQGRFSYRHADTSSKVLWVLVCVRRYQLSNAWWCWSWPWGLMCFTHSSVSWRGNQAAHRNVDKQVILKLSFVLFSHFLLPEDWKKEWDKWQRRILLTFILLQITCFYYNQVSEEIAFPKLKRFHCWMWVLSALPEWQRLCTAKHTLQPFNKWVPFLFSVCLVLLIVGRLSSKRAEGGEI